LVQLSAAAGLQALLAATKSATDAKLGGAWTLSFGQSPDGVPGKLDVTAAPPITLNVSLSSAEQRVGIARAVARALCADGTS
jgi:hypothetical protein